jgi:hypothetical protein
VVFQVKFDLCVGWSDGNIALDHVDQHAGTPCGDIRRPGTAC